jgi:hypothetical protein
LIDVEGKTNAQWDEILAKGLAKKLGVSVKSITQEQIDIFLAELRQQNGYVTQSGDVFFGNDDSFALHHQARRGVNKSNIEAAERLAESAVNKLNLAEAAASALKSKVLGIVGAVAALGSISAIVVYHWHKISEAIADSVNKAYSLQTSVNNITAWSTASTLATGKANEFANGIEGLHRKINDLSIMPLENMADIFSGGFRAFSFIGLSPYQLRGLDSNSQLIAVAEGLSKVKDKTLQLQLANELLGSSGAAMVQYYLKDGAAGIERMKKESEKLNLTLSEGQIKALEESVHSWRVLKLELQGFWQHVSADVSPIISDILSLAGAFVQLATWIERAAEKFSAFMEHPFESITGYQSIWHMLGITNPTPRPTSTADTNSPNKTLQELLNVNRQIMTIDANMLAQTLKQAAPPHVNYSW